MGMTLKELKEKRKGFISEIDAKNTPAELEALELEIRKIDTKIKNFEQEPAVKQDETEERTAAINNITAAVVANSLEKKADLELSEFATKTASLEYRRAFYNYIKSGQRDKVLQAPEKRADTFTATTDAGAVIPVTILNEVIGLLKKYGNIYELVRKTSVTGGLVVPTLTLRPEATWIDEGVGGDRQKVKLGNISFSYFTLECKLATSFVLNVASLSLFENSLKEILAEAFAQALDKAILSGTGTGQPLGILKDPAVKAAQTITLSAADFGKWGEWKKQVFAKIPRSYKNGIFAMAQGTFEGYIAGMVDTTGQPIGRVNYGIDGAETYRFGGKSIETVEDDVIKDYDTAAVGDVVAVYFVPKNYVVNSNMEISMYKYMDHDTNQIIDKALMITDGRLIDAGGVLIIKKGA